MYIIKYCVSCFSLAVIENPNQREKIPSGREHRNRCRPTAKPKVNLRESCTRKGGRVGRRYLYFYFVVVIVLVVFSCICTCISVHGKMVTS